MRRAGYARPVSLKLIVFLAACGISLPIYKTGNEREGYSKHISISADIQGITTQLKLYESMNGFMPTTEQGLMAMTVEPDTNPKPTRWYPLFKEVPRDPWKNPYIYRKPGTKNRNSYDLFSAGPDRKPDTADDDWGS